MQPASRTANDRTNTRVDALRFGCDPDPRGNSKEWMHFCTFGRARGGIDVLINFSMMCERGQSTPVPRLLMIVGDEDGGRGGVQTFDSRAAQAESGETDLSFGRCHMRYADGAYQLRAELPEQGVFANLRFTAQTTHIMTPASRMGDGNVRWLIVPRMQVNGQVRIDSVTHTLTDQLGYHDHNWGRFAWGDNFAWHWAIVLPEDDTGASAVVLSRVLDRNNNRLLSNTVIVGDGRAFRDYRGSEVRVRRRGLCRQSPRTQVPGALRLALRSGQADVPEFTDVDMTSADDHLQLSLATRDYDQIGLPTDNADGAIALLNEINAQASGQMHIRGRTFCLDGPALLEMTTVAR